ncbi:MAG: hypothetical protein V3V15_01180 [Sphingorhabdus sp.]
MTTIPWQQSFPQSAEVFPFMLDTAQDELLLMRLSEEDFAAASFLDERLFSASAQKHVVPWAEVAAIDLPQTPQPDYIFHIGHVGSTLISRLLGEVSGVFALREPLLLRALAEMRSADDFTVRKEKTVAWLSRSFRKTDRAMIKATSFVSGIAGQLLNKDSRALFLYLPLQSYMETILAGEASLRETEAMAQSRLERINTRLDLPVEFGAESGVYQQVAVSWLCEMACLFEAQKLQPDARIMWIDFNQFLTAPKDSWAGLLAHFDLQMTAGESCELLSGPIMTSYSKAPEHSYDADLRGQLLAQAREKHGAGIAECRLWVDGLAKQHPLIEKLLNFSDRDGSCSSI